MREPMMTVRSRGSWKYSAASAVICDVAMNRRLRQRLRPGVSPGTSSMRDTKSDGFSSGRGRSVAAARVGGDVRALRGGKVGYGFCFDRENDDVLVEDLVEIDVRPQRQRGGGLAAVEEDGGARYPGQRRLHGVQLVDERAERPLLAVPLNRDQSAASLPRGEDGERGDPDQQRQPRTVGQLGQVGGEKEQVDGEQDAAAAQHEP